MSDADTLLFEKSCFRDQAPTEYCLALTHYAGNKKGINNHPDCDNKKRNVRNGILMAEPVFPE